ncbi:hypothetical protein Lal_00017036 [Lupinus albus]|nr:hypothetical protein Lal_00017036 [Lupinus albus]
MDQEFTDEGIMTLPSKYEEKDNKMTFMFNGASNRNFTHITMRLCLECINNISKYEVCALGLQEAIESKFQRLFNYAWIIHKLKGEWETCDCKLIPYKDYIQELVEQFKQINFYLIYIEDNWLADALSTLSISLLQHHRSGRRWETFVPQYKITHQKEGVLCKRCNIPKVSIFEYGGYQEVWELLSDSRLSERSSPKRGLSAFFWESRLNEREVLILDESRLSKKTSPEREHQFLNDVKSRGFSPKRTYPRLSEKKRNSWESCAPLESRKRPEKSKLRRYKRNHDTMHRSKEVVVALKYVHEVSFETHSKGHVMGKKILRASYYWLPMLTDYYNYVWKCQKYKIYVDNINEPPNSLDVLSESQPFFM